MDLAHNSTVGVYPLIVRTNLYRAHKAQKAHKAFLAATWSGGKFGAGWGPGFRPFGAFTRPRLEEFVVSAIGSDTSTVFVHRLADTDRPVSIAVFETFSGGNWWYRNDGPVVKAYRRGITNLVDIRFLSTHRQFENSAAHMIDTVLAHAREHLFGGEAFVVVADCAGFQRTVFEKIEFVHMGTFLTKDKNIAPEMLHRMLRVIE